ncbi:MAG: FecR family protein [Burkholderiales bacterium]
MSAAQRILACLLLLAGGSAGAQEAGRVILSIGEVTIQRGAAVSAAPVGSVLNNGDTIRVGAASNAQVRFVDEAIIALRPGTEFKVDDYNWPGAASGVERAFFSLLKGGLRTVTGAIGKTNQQNYRVTTPTATIGIRGTNFNLVHCDAECQNRDGSAARGGTYGGIFDGRIGVANQAGEAVFGVDEFFHVASLTSLPERLIGPPPFLGDRLAGATRRKGEKGTESSETMAKSGVNADSRPLAAPAPVPPQAFVVTENFNESGQRSVVSTTFAHVVIPAHSEFNGNAATDVLGANVVDMVFAGSGASQTLVSVIARPNAAVDQEGGQGSVGPSGTDMVGYGAAVNAHWGRWIDGKVDASEVPGGFFVPPTGVHYLYSDQITPAEVIAAKTGQFSYNVSVGGTNPTDNSGNIGTFGGGSVSVNFTYRNAALNASWTVGSSTYSVSGVAGATPSGLSGPVKIFPGIAAGVEMSGSNVGSCSGPCGGVSPGPIQKVEANGVFLGPTGNHLPVSIGSQNGTQTTSQVRLFFCPTCP